MTSRPPADWQLPPGVDRGLWDYLHDSGIARNYDQGLEGASLFAVDETYVDRHCPPQGRLLDLGCGTGRLLLSQARRGRRVVGVDLSWPMLTEARAKLAAAGVPINLVRANLVALDCLAPESFDCVACLFSTLGMIRGVAARRRVLEHAFRCLRPGGSFVLHVHNRWFNAWDRAGRRWLLADFLHSMMGGQSGERRMPPHQGISAITLHLFTRREVLGLLRGVGLDIREVQPIGLRPDGRVSCPAWFGWLRAYGYLVAAQKPSAAHP